MNANCEMGKHTKTRNPPIRLMREVTDIQMHESSGTSYMPAVWLIGVTEISESRVLLPSVFNFFVS